MIKLKGAREYICTFSLKCVYIYFPSISRRIGMYNDLFIASYVFMNGSYTWCMKSVSSFMKRSVSLSLSPPITLLIFSGFGPPPSHTDSPS